MTSARRTLISVSNREHILKLAKCFISHNIEIIATTGTANELKKNGIVCKEVSEITNLSHMLDGRVKSLHPDIYAAILADRKNTSHMKELHSKSILPIEFVVVNLYPFEEIVSKKDVSEALAIENIDIGGPTLIRAAAR